MAIVDPFETAAASAPKGIVDPFEKPEAGGVLSDVGSETAKAFMSGWQHLHPTPTPPPPDTAGFWSGMLRVPGAGLAGDLFTRAGAPLEMATAPIIGPLHALGGRGLAGLESYAGEAAQAGLRRLGLAKDVPAPDRQQMYEQAKADIDRALLAAGPARTGATVTGAPWGRIGPAVETDIAAAEQAQAAKTAAKPPPSPPAPGEAERLAAAGMQVNIPRAFSIQNPMLQAGSVALSKAPIIGTPLNEAIAAVPAQVGGHVETIAGQYGRPLPENIVGSGVERTLTGAAERERAAAEAQAQAEHTAALQQWEQQNQAREQAINAQQTQAETAARQQFGNVEPNQMAENTTNAVQARHARQEAENQANWREVNNLDAHANKGAFDNLHGSVEQGLSAEGVTLDPVRTPNAWSMMQELRRLSGQAPVGEAIGVPPRLMQALETSYGKGQVPPHVLEDLVPGSTAGMLPGKDPQFRLMGQHAPAPDSPTVTVQGLDQLRKRVGEMAFDATSNTDRRASNTIKSLFGDFLDDTLENHLAPGSNPNARTVIQRAIDSHRDFRERFGYNTSRLRGEDKTAARTLNLMATGDIGPEAVAQNLVGSGKPGTRPGSSPLHDAIMNAVENPAAVRADMRGAYWNALTEGKTPRAIASNVDELRNTRMGRNLFEPHEHDAMGRFAEIQQQTPEALKAAEAEARRTAPKLAKVEPGPAEQLARRTVGRTGAGEEVLSRFDSAIRKGGDIKEAARIWGRMSDVNRKEATGAWLRGLGGGGEDFSLAKFIKNWDDYSDQAKAFMLGREHRQNLNDFHGLAKQYADTIKKYGNPSGTAQVSAWHNLITGAVKTGIGIATGATAAFHPIGVAIAGLGLRRLSGILATPQGTRQIVQWGNLAKSYQSAPSASKLTALSNLTRTLNASKD